MRAPRASRVSSRHMFVFFPLIIGANRATKKRL